MKHILVTGSCGFIGQNLISALQVDPDVALLTFDLENTPADLANALDQADVIFHLAGVNRPKDPQEFATGNTGLTQSICQHLIAKGRKPQLVMSSSVQAELDNPYGVSKRQAEEAVQQYAAKTGAAVVIYRLPNVFGKGCRPNYNSAVATFCHNIAHNLPITVNDPKVALKLVYIDDVVEEFLRVLAVGPTRQGAFCAVPTVHAVSLGEIVDLLYSFRQSRTDLQVPNQADPFTRKLYATYLSYLPADQFSYPLKMNVDARGSFTEFLKTKERGQVSVNISKPKITKGNHWHHTKNEKFLVVSGRGIIRFRRVGSAESGAGSGIVEYPVSGEKLVVVDIPPGYTHNIENTGDTDLVTVMWANEPFNPQKPDTIVASVALQ